MASKKFIKGSLEWQMFADYWGICQKFWEPEEEDEYWEALTASAGEFSEKYKDIPLARRLICALVEELDEEAKIL